MEPTHKFNLVTGVECEITELTGLQQKILTKGGSKKIGDNMVKMIQSVVVRIGSLTGKDITEELIESLLVADRRKLLVELRGFSTEWEKTFEFDWPYTSKADGSKKTHHLELPLDDGFPQKGYQIVNPDGTYSPMNCKEYSEVPREYEITLPRSQDRVLVKYLDSKGESIIAAKKEEERSSHVLLEARNPRTLDGGTPIQTNLDKLKLKDIEHIRTVIKEAEGQVDTLILFDHPEANLMPENKKVVRVDVLNELAFFYPSQAM
jgi:hypothetical protein